MDLGCGEYLVITNCVKMPYSTDSMAKFFKIIEVDIEAHDRIVYFDSKPNSINYDLVWEGLNTFDKKTYENCYIVSYPLSSIDIRLKDGMMGRIQVTFLDQFSYEISLITNYTQAFEECNDNEMKSAKAKRIEEIALIMFGCFEPFYGNIGLEVSSVGISELKSEKRLLPLEKVYVSFELCDSLIKRNLDYFMYYRLFDKGIYLRQSLIYDYLYTSPSKIRDVIIGDCNFFKHH